MLPGKVLFLDLGQGVPPHVWRAHAYSLAPGDTAVILFLRNRLSSVPA